MSDSSFEQIGDIFTEALAEVISTATGFSFDIQPALDQDSFDDIVGIMGLYGESRGMLFISMNEALMRVLCSYMIGVTLENISREDIEDALCELVNMTAGSAKRQLNGEDDAFTLSPPFVMRGQNLSVVHKHRVHVVARRLGNGGKSLMMRVVFY